MLLACQNISKAFGTKEVLKDINFHVNEKEKIAIVGINGSGKTTLLKIIMGEESADSGQVVIAKDTTIGYLSQHQDISFDNTIYGEMLATKQYILDLEANIRRLEQDMKHAEGEELEKILETYNRLSSKYDRDNGYSYESEITGVLKGLGFGPEDYDRHINTLSGGQKMRIALGRLLLTRPDIIILDEPTNHLDMPSISWLESFLSSYPGSVIVVSHDRYFIDRIATQIVEIDNKKATVYHGNYTYFASKRAEIRANMMKAYLNQQQEIKHQEAVITKLKQFNREKSIKRAESREKMLEKMEVLDRPDTEVQELKLSLEPRFPSGNDVLRVEGLAKSFGDHTLFTDLDFEIKRGERVALIGNNGTGKTTILKIINKLVPKDDGTVILGSRVKIGYYDQEHQVLNMNNTVFDEISNAYPDLTNTRIRNVLAAFLFTGEDVFKRIADLSGGEKGRVSLAKMMLSSANFLILDEPTNHLDITSKEILEEAIRNYTGTVLYVSHDRYFINQTATRIIELKDKQLTNYIGNYDYYESHRAQPASTGKQAFAPVSDTVSQEKQAESQAKLSWKENKAEQARLRKKANDLKKLEDKIEQLENRLAEIDEEFLVPENATNVALLNDLTKERNSVEEELNTMYEQWEELSSEE